MSGPFIRRTFNISQIPEGKFVKTSDVAKAIGVETQSLKKWSKIYGFPERLFARDLDIPQISGNMTMLKRDDVIAWLKRYGR